MLPQPTSDISRPNEPIGEQNSRHFSLNAFRESDYHRKYLGAGHDGGVAGGSRNCTPPPVAPMASPGSIVCNAPHAPPSSTAAGVNCGGNHLGSSVHHHHSQAHYPHLASLPCASQRASHASPLLMGSTPPGPYGTPPLHPSSTGASRTLASVTSHATPGSGMPVHSSSLHDFSHHRICGLSGERSQPNDDAAGEGAEGDSAGSEVDDALALFGHKVHAGSWLVEMQRRQ
jgi:hypothetical protein